jgi:putative FmdB family regulatory protein
MPLYEYECLKCGRRTELLQRHGEPPLAACPECGGEVRKLISSPAFQFKGSGWYVTDYAGKKGGDAKSEGKSESKSEGEGRNGKPDKPETADKPKETAAASKSSGSSSE